MYEALLRSPAFAASERPELAVRLGAPLTSKIANQWLEPVPSVLVDPHGGWLDPSRSASHRMVVDPGALLDATATLLAGHPPAATRERWQRADAIARGALDALLATGDVTCEARIARDVAAHVPDGGQLVVASSLAVRALEWTMEPRAITVHANRGANGIDGFVSTTLGVAFGTRSPTVALLGDLCFLHDVNGLLGAAERGAGATFVVVDNAGGGIFSYLPQRDALEAAVFDQLFATPQPVDLVAVAEAHGAPASRVHGAADLPAALKDAVHRGGVHVLVVDVDQSRSVERHRALWAAVDAALAAPRSS